MHEILFLKDEQRWNNLLSRLPDHLKDVAYTPQYYRLFEELGAGIANCFVYQDNENLAIYPFLINSVNKLGYILPDEYYDIQGAYGYNGPLLTTYESWFLEKFSIAFCKFCKLNNIIAEFTRFNPLLNNHIGLHHLVPFNSNDVINVDLSISKEQIWSNSYRKSVRQIINKCNNAELKEKIILIGEASDKDIEDFISIYYSTLERNSANDFYYFNTEYIYNIRKKLPNNILFALVYYNSKPIAASINPFMGTNSYGFLGGSLKEYSKINPFTYMLHKVIMKLKDFGLKNYLLGGGHERGDGIFNYKLSLARNGIINFYIGKKIHNMTIYNEVVAQWQKKSLDKVETYKNQILKYRY